MQDRPLTEIQIAQLCVEKLGKVSNAYAGEANQPQLMDAKRLFHGRGHMFVGWEHLVINWFGPYLLIASFKDTAAEERDALVEALRDAFDQAHIELKGIGWQARDGRKTQTHVLWGEVPDEHVVLEAGLKYLVHPKRNQNVGLFMDMSHVRAHLAQYMNDAKVLNLFAYTCAFSVSAIANGAQMVVNNDMSANSLKVGEHNHQLNEHDSRRVRMLPHNLFKSWWKIRQFGPYDIMIIDPPTNQRGSFVAEKSYGQVLKRIPEIVKPGGRVIACLNSPFLGPEFITQQMQKWCAQAELIDFLPMHEDFPDKYPERALKVAEFIYRP